MFFNRRSFLKNSAYVSAAGFGLFPNQNIFASEFLSNNIYSNPPIDILNQFSGTTLFTGDHEMEGHEIFWDKQGFLRKYGPIPVATEQYDLVVIGGGMAGLCSAYQHRSKKILMLEGHPQMGGNSKAERFENLTMSLGAAYVTLPEKDDPIDRFYNELGIAHKFRQEPAEEFTVGLNGKIASHFWDGGSDMEAALAFKSVFNKFVDIYNGDYPDLPIFPTFENRELLNELDRLSFSQWVQQNLVDIHPHIHEFFHQYCWSSFGGSIQEISAAQAINFIASDLAGIQTLPGGNAGIAQAIYNQLKNSQVKMQNKCFAVNVASTLGGVDITYFNAGKLITAKAKKVIMACSKQVAKYLIQDLSQTTYQTMANMDYRAYLLVNILLKKKISSLGYDIYALREKLPTQPRKDINERGFCDVAFADWANLDQSKYSALTLYIPQPYEGANQFLFSPFTYEKHKARILENIGPWLKNLGLTISDIEGFRMTRYGHALPLARVGAIASGDLESVHTPIDDRIYFAHTDNWANPCFETAFYSAFALRSI